ncbi:caspase, EACC1-associated type [Adonisia turfae]|nr:SUMF1/EgtB/PvdO family nonheme iron enzyme [Adonisia turfae]
MAKKIALLIGVGEYGNGLKPLRCPANGVKTMQVLLRNPDIGGFDEVVPLINPDVGTMQARIGEVFGQLSKNDLVLFYFTGHGIKDMTGKFYLSTAQTQLFESGTLNPGTAVSADFVKGVIGNSLAQRKVVILDCCFGAAFAKGFLGMDDSSIDVETQLGGKGWCVLTASTSTKYALEQEGEDLSVYTRYLVEGLKTGGAAPDGQELICIRDLHSYVQIQVKAAAPAMEPTIFNAKQGEEIVIARVQLDNSQRYRKQVQTKIKNIRNITLNEFALNGNYWTLADVIRPTAFHNLTLLKEQLGLTNEVTEAIQEEFLKPYREKTKSLAKYADCLKAEKDYGYPLDNDAIKELEESKQLLNLRDDDVQLVENKILGHWLKQQPHKQLPVESSTLPNKKPVSDLSAQKYQQQQQQQQQKLKHPKFSFKTVKVNNKGNVIETKQSKAECFAEDLGNDITLEMVHIPSGTFMMGAAEGEPGASGYEYPQHKVTVPEFWMGKFAITQEQWQAVARLKKVERDLESDPAHFKGVKRPVECVSWQDAEEFCKRLSKKTEKEYMLPSEAQWEYACRAETTTPFHFGLAITTELANYDGSTYYWSYSYGSASREKYRQETIDVGSFAIANAFGLYDMHGNVWEWCLDHWHDSYTGAPTNGNAWVTGGDSSLRILRGGSWNYNPGYCRSTKRRRANLGNRLNSFGFRVVCFSART